MALTEELRQKHGHLWERMVTHPFVGEMGDGTLPVEKFRRYFLQDYVFARDLVSLVALGVSKAPDFGAAGHLNRFLTAIVDPENDLFVRAFRELGVSEGEYLSAEASPTTRAFGDFMMHMGMGGSFEDIVTVLYVTEGTYLDWGTRLAESGRDPDNRVYREWIEIHGPEVLGDFVGWMGAYLDGSTTEELRPRIERTFLTALRYEYLFWEAAYHGERWPGQA